MEIQVSAQCFFLSPKSYPSKWTLEGAMHQSLISNVFKNVSENENVS